MKLRYASLCTRRVAIHERAYQFVVGPVPVGQTGRLGGRFSADYLSAVFLLFRKRTLLRGIPDALDRGAAAARLCSRRVCGHNDSTQSKSWP